MGHYNKLGFVTKFPQHTGKFVDINIIQRRIYLIQDTIGACLLYTSDAADE